MGSSLHVAFLEKVLNLALPMSKTNLSTKDERPTFCSLRKQTNKQTNKQPAQNLILYQYRTVQSGEVFGNFYINIFFWKKNDLNWCQHSNVREI